VAPDLSIGGGTIVSNPRPVSERVGSGTVATEEVTGFPKFVYQRLAAISVDIHSRAAIRITPIIRFFTDFRGLQLTARVKSSLSQKSGIPEPYVRTGFTILDRSRWRRG
jgi:hypothetical protein